MGLDCYVRTPVITDDPDALNAKNLWYGRKENEIHGWMQRQSGMSSEEFNCVDFDLTSEVMDKFESAMNHGLLTPVTGFFFGGANDKEQVLSAAQALLYVARTAIDAGRKPYYTSSW